MAEADGRIYITISDEPLSNGKDGSDGKDGEDGVAETKKEKALNALTHRALHFILNEAKQAINYSVSHIGVKTGDYVAQHNAQASMNMAYKGVGIGLAAISGAKLGAKIGAAGGPWGAAIGAGVGTLLVTTNVVHQWFDYKRQIKLQNDDIALLRERAGLDSTNNGSR